MAVGPETILMSRNGRYCARCWNKGSQQANIDISIAEPLLATPGQRCTHCGLEQPSSC